MGCDNSLLVVGSLAGLRLREESDDEMRNRGMERVLGPGSAGRIGRREKPSCFLLLKITELLNINVTSFAQAIKANISQRYLGIRYSTCLFLCFLLNYTYSVLGSDQFTFVTSILS